MRYRSILFALMTVGGSAPALATDLRVLTLNLHGYHPMGEAERWARMGDGSLVRQPSHPFYFTRDELERGSGRQMEALSDAIDRLQVDIVALQEVAAGLPEQNKTCDDFHATHGGDVLGTNTAVRLQRRLADQGYAVHLACRGNVGWTTSEGTFAATSIGRRRVDGSFEALYSGRANPYPRGLLVEGFALLVKAPWTVRENAVLRVPFNERGDVAMAQFAIIDHPTAGWLALLNLHAGHKLAHFEQAVAFRRKVLELVAARRDAWRHRTYLGTMMAGDFNAYLHRPSEPIAESGARTEEVSSVPWELRHGSSYDYTSPSMVREKLASELKVINDDSAYKPWASVTNAEEAERRIAQAVEALARLLEADDDLAQTEMLSAAQVGGRCTPSPLVEGACEVEGRIDHVYMATPLNLANAFVAFPRNDFVSTAGTSDHPGLFVALDGL